MADSKGEAAMKGLKTLVAGIAWTDGKSPTVVRNEAVPASVPADGHINVADGDPGDPEIILSPVTYDYIHEAEVTFYAQGADADVRATQIDGQTQDFGQALANDDTLGGLVDHVEAGPPSPVDEPVESGLPIRAVVVPVFLYYTTDTPLG